MILKDGMILYHGSYADIKKIDLSLCDRTKDFGQGFYLTSSKKQAISFIKTSLAKARSNGKAPENQTYGYVTAFKVNLSNDINYYEFETTNKDWLYYISINRRKYLSEQFRQLLSQDYDKYELLVGRIANDDTNMTLNNFLAGAFGDVTSEQSIAIVRQLLKPERLENQFCFKSEKVINMLERIGSEKYEI